MREIDEFDDAVHHREAQCEQRVHHAQGQAIDELLQDDSFRDSHYLAGMEDEEGASRPPPASLRLWRSADELIEPILDLEDRNDLVLQITVFVEVDDALKRWQAGCLCVIANVV